MEGKVRKRSMSKQDRLELFRKYSAITLLVIFIILNSFLTPNFFRLNNLNNIITQMAPTILTGMGMTLVISTGGIDISVGSLMALSGVLSALFVPSMGLVPGLLLGIVAAGAVGLFSGFMVGKLKLQPMVVTLGLMLGIRGVAQVASGGRDIYFNKLGQVGEQFSVLGSFKIAGVLPVQILPMLLAVAAVWVIVEKTVLGKQIEAVGDSIRSSALSGINTGRTMMIVYGISALFAGFAGILQAAKVSVAAGSSLGQLAELDAIAAVVIGGTPMSGGKARVVGTVIGALIMQMITLTCVMNNIPDQYAQVFKAVIIVFAVWIQREQNK